MSPVSRGRKPRKNGRSGAGKPTRRGRPALAAVDQLASGCDCPVCRGEDVDPAELIDSVLDDATELVDAEDPLDAEVAGAALAAMVTRAVGRAGVVDDRDAGRVLVDGLVPAFEARASTEAMALLLALGAVAPDPAGAAASAAARRLARAGVTGPRWADELTTPVAVGRCQRLADRGETGAVLAAGFARAGRSHVVLVCADGLDCGAAAGIALLDGDELPDVWALVGNEGSDPTGAIGGPGEVVVDTLDAAEWRWQVENALDARAVHDHDDGLDGPGPDGFDLDGLGPDEDEQDGPAGYPAMALLLRARLAAMPASAKPRLPHGGHDEDSTLDLAALGHLLQQLPGGGGGRNRSGRSGPGRRATLPAKRARQDRPAPIYQIKVGLRHTKPPIWRRLELPADTSLATLHGIIQVAFGWDDGHLHVFDTPYGEFGRTDPGLGHRAEAPVTLEQVAPTAADKIGYTYDFGDDWRLDITVEKLLPAEPAARYPRCTGGRRAAPPEDSGGVWGYQNLVEALADPAHPDHDDRLEWLGCTDPADFDPARFDPDAVTRALTRR